MSRNANSQFSHLPQVDIERSKFHRPSSHKTTMNTGSLVPIYIDEILPGDTVTMDVASLVRMTTPVFPVMDNAYLDTYFFFVPNRLVWDHWREFNGENNTSFWTQPVEYNVPQLVFPRGADRGSVADYMGIPTEVACSVNAMPFRSYALIWNEWFRDQNVMQPGYIYKGDENLNGVRIDDQEDSVLIDYASAALGGKCLPVSRFHDYFSSCLPSPQKGEAVSIPLFDGIVPVTTYDGSAEGLSSVGMRFQGDLGMADSGQVAYGIGIDYSLNGGVYLGEGYVYPDSDVSVRPPSTIAFDLIPDNLGVDARNLAAATINQLRQAFQIQRIFERDARGGTRYTELLQAHFGVTNPDARMQRPEYLGGKRIPINMDQVLQTSATNEVSPQGNTAAFSLTTDVSSLFTKSFTEHGFLIGLACIRTDHTYQQGIERFWSRKRRFDYYWPALAHIGEQAVLKKELYATGEPGDDEAFGYQEAWADYRYKPDRVSGAFRSNVQGGSLDSWHYADFYTDVNQQDFVIQADWLAETPENVDRTLAVQSSLEDQFLCDFRFNADFVRPMPLYSVPGLIDHF